MAFSATSSKFVQARASSCKLSLPPKLASSRTSTRGKCEPRSTVMVTASLGRHSASHNSDFSRSTVHAARRTLGCISTEPPSRLAAVEKQQEKLPPGLMIGWLDRCEDGRELPPLASMGDFMVARLRVPGRAPSKFATEAELEVAALVQGCWGMDPNSFAIYNRIGVAFSSFVFPSTVSAQRLRAVCIHQGLFSLLDDLCFDTDGLDPADFGIQDSIVRNSPRVGDFFRDVNAVFRTLQLPSQVEPTPVDLAMLQAATELRRLAGCEWHRHFADAVEDFVDSCITLQADLKVGGPRLSVRDVESYTHIRCRNSAMLHVCMLMEVACDAILPAEVRAHPSIQRLTELAADIVAFVNDIFSYHKDVMVEGSQFNLIKVLMDTERLSFVRAVQCAMELVISTTQSFADIEAKLSLWESPEVDRIVRRYVLCLRECIVGSYHFHGRINRYRSPDSPFAELRTLV